MLWSWASKSQQPRSHVTVIRKETSGGLIGTTRDIGFDRRQCHAMLDVSAVLSIAD